MIAPEYFELLPVKTIKTITRSKPHKAIAILQDTPYRIMRQAIFYLVFLEIE